MKFLLLEIWIYLLVAFLLGAFMQWFFCCRGKSHDQQPADELPATAMPSATQSEVTTSAGLSASDKPVISDDWRPITFDAAPDKVDELKRIKGIGAVIEVTLNELGIYQFQQIAQWSEDNITWVDNYLAFPGRVKREDWVNQAHTLANGGTTEFAQRVDKGELDYNKTS